MIFKKFTYPILVLVFAAIILVAWFAVLGPARVSGSDCDSQSVGCPAESEGGNFSSLAITDEVLTPTALLPIITKPCPVLFADSFDDPNSGWPEWNTNNTSGKYDNGHYRVYMKKAGFWVASVPNKFYGANGYKVNVEVKNVSGIDGSYGLVFDENGDGNNFWFKSFEVSPNGNYSIWQYDSRTATEWDLLANGFSGDINTGTKNNLLSIRWHNKSITAYANDQMVEQLNLASMQSSSAAGIYVESFDQPNVEVHFDNFVVENPTCGLQPIAPEFSPDALEQGGNTEALYLEILSGDDFRRRFLRP